MWKVCKCEGKDMLEFLSYGYQYHTNERFKLLEDIKEERRKKMKERGEI